MLCWLFRYGLQFADADGWFVRLKALVAEEEQKLASTARAAQSMEEIKTLLRKFHNTVSASAANAASS